MVISLPKNWMQLNELNKGDVVSLAIQRDRSLVVYPGVEKKPEPKEITLKIEEKEDEELIAQKIIGSFLNGYSGVTLISEKIFSIPQRKAIRNIAGRLYMRIMESDSKGVYMQTLTDESKASLDQAIQDTFTRLVTFQVLGFCDQLWLSVAIASFTKSVAKKYRIIAKAEMT